MRIIWIRPIDAYPIVAVASDVSVATVSVAPYVATVAVAPYVATVAVAVAPDVAFAAPVAESEKVCGSILKSGANKGKPCGKVCASGLATCATHK